MTTTAAVVQQALETKDLVNWLFAMVGGLFVLIGTFIAIIANNFNTRLKTVEAKHVGTDAFKEYKEDRHERDKQLDKTLDEIKKAVTDGLDGVHNRVDDLYKVTETRRVRE